MSRQPKPIPEPEWHASWYGTQVYFNPAIAAGTVRLYDRRGRPIGAFDDVGRIEVAGRSEAATART